MKYSGTISRGVKAPIIRKGDNLIELIPQCIKNIVEDEHLTLHDKDVVCITEAIVGRSQGNYATIDQIAKDVHNKFKDETVGLLFPINSRNRFSILLKGIAKGVKKLIIQLSYPGDEVGNKLCNPELLYENNFDFNKTYTAKEFKSIVGETVHAFTGVDYIDFYQNIAPNIEIILSNDPRSILNYTKSVLVASIHSRNHDKTILKKNGANIVYGLDDILTCSVDGSGYHEKYGLLGSNLATEDTVKLFPRNCQTLVESIQKELKKIFNVNLEVMVYGDGAFKDPQGGIWELADPVVSPGYTSGLIGTPNELKLKFLADNKLKHLNGEQLNNEMKKLIKEKDANLKGKNETLGTTPRQLTDLLGSLADLTSGSGDKGTPIILIQNYFNNYADE